MMQIRNIIEGRTWQSILIFNFVLNLTLHFKDKGGAITMFNLSEMLSYTKDVEDSVY